MSEREKLADELERKHKLLFDIETQLSPAHPHYTADRAMELAAHWGEAALSFRVACQENIATLLAALRADSDAAVERAAEAICDRDYLTDETWAEIGDSIRDDYRETARAALRAALEPQR